MLLGLEVQGYRVSGSRSSWERDRGFWLAGSFRLFRAMRAIVF